MTRCAQSASLPASGAYDFLFNSQYLRWMHGKAAQAQSEQQAGKGGIACHFAAYAYGLACCIGGADGGSEQLQNAWVRGRRVGYGFVGAVNGERVLRQVVGADGEEIEMLQKQWRNDGCRLEFQSWRQCTEP